MQKKKEKEYRCPGGMEYLYITPRTKDDFIRVVEQSDEVFVVNFFNDENLRCLQMQTAWEKFALIFGKKMRLILYQLGEPVADHMARELGAVDEGTPNWRLYYLRSPELEHMNHTELSAIESDIRDRIQQENEEDMDRFYLEDQAKAAAAASAKNSAVPPPPTIDPNHPDPEAAIKEHMKQFDEHVKAEMERAAQEDAEELQEHGMISDESLVEEGSGDLDPSIVPKNLLHKKKQQDTTGDAKKARNPSSPSKESPSEPPAKPKHKAHFYQIVGEKGDAFSRIRQKVQELTGGLKEKANGFLKKGPL